MSNSMVINQMAEEIGLLKTRLENVNAQNAGLSQRCMRYAAESEKQSAEHLATTDRMIAEVNNAEKHSRQLKEALDEERRHTNELCRDLAHLQNETRRINKELNKEVADLKAQLSLADSTGQGSALRATQLFEETESLKKQLVQADADHAEALELLGKFQNNEILVGLRMECQKALDMVTQQGVVINQLNKTVAQQREEHAGLVIKNRQGLIIGTDNDRLRKTLSAERDQHAALKGHCTKKTWK